MSSGYIFVRFQRDIFPGAHGFSLLFSIQRFQTAVVKHMSVDVCVVLPRFKLTVVRVTLLPVAKHNQETQQTVLRTDGAEVCDTAVEQKDCGHKNLAYVLHTSGTTGFPKTVRVPHKCILPNILHLR